MFHHHDNSNYSFTPLLLGGYIFNLLDSKRVMSSLKLILVLVGSRYTKNLMDSWNVLMIDRVLCHFNFLPKPFKKLLVVNKAAIRFGWYMMFSY